jgi:hypothetical protein
MHTHTCTYLGPHTCMYKYRHKVHKNLYHNILRKYGNEIEVQSLNKISKINVAQVSFGIYRNSNPFTTHLTTLKEKEFY